MNLDNIDISKPPADIRKTFKQLQVLHAEKKIQNKAKEDFLSFVKCVWPDFVEGSHHRHIADKFNKLATGEINRLIVNMPPRHTKSEFASYLLPDEIFGEEIYSSFKGFLILLVSGFLIGFGTRYAGGCTSGHAITGLSSLQFPSLLAVIGFFIGDVLATWFIVPSIF